MFLLETLEKLFLLTVSFLHETLNIFAYIIVGHTYTYQALTWQQAYRLIFLL